MATKRKGKEPKNSPKKTKAKANDLQDSERSMSSKSR
jgi:hypothetical protein